MHGDSDISYFKHMDTPERIEQITRTSIYFVKIGSKITETSQRMDLGLVYKKLMVTDKLITSLV